MKAYHLQQGSLPDIQIDITTRGTPEIQIQRNKHVSSSFISVPTHESIQFLCSKPCGVSASPRHKISLPNIFLPPSTHLPVPAHLPLISLPWMITLAFSLLIFSHFHLHCPLLTLFSEKDPSTVFHDTHEIHAVENDICSFFMMYSLLSL